MKIYYGIFTNSIDVTSICMTRLNKNNIITIPAGDLNRAGYFTDPVFGVTKKIIILKDSVVTEYDDFLQVKINVLDNTITTVNEGIVNNKLINIQSKLKIKHGTFNEELPEQKMVTRYLTGTEKVLEIGGNIGRNSLIIAAILQDSTNLVVLESDANIANQLTENKILNNFNFHVESSALSNRKLIQQGWETKPSDTLQTGYKWAKTITLENLKTKYNIEFDTLVLDCEGSFYYILMDMPELLNNINLIIMENDYHNIEHKNYIDGILKKNNFSVDYTECGGWGPCYDNFFEVWKKNDN
jgi:FkbM family methyltransferase